MDEVTEYLQQFNQPQKDALQRIRDIILKTVPECTEDVSYGMPATKYKGKPLMYYNAFKDHLSIFPTGGPAEALADQLTDFKTSKGTIQFTVDKQVPEDIIVQLLQLRIETIG